MGSDGEGHIFTWSSAIVVAEETRGLQRIAELLRDENIPLDIYDRRLLAELLVPSRKGAVLEAVLQPPRGRPNQDLRNYDFFVALENYKFHQKVKKIPQEVVEKLGKVFGLLSYKACQSARRRGRIISEAVAAANNE